MTADRDDLRDRVADIEADDADPLGDVYVTFGPDPDDPEDIPENSRTIDFNDVDT